MTSLVRLSLWLLLAVAIGLGLLSAREWRAETLAAHAAQVRERDRLTTTVADLAQREAQLRGGGTLPYAWDAEREGEALALIQSHVADLAGSHGVSLRSMTPTPAPDFPILRGLGLRIEGEARLDRLADFLVAMEHGERALVVRTANLRRIPRPGEGAVQPIVLVQLDLAAPVRVAEDDA